MTASAWDRIRAFALDYLVILAYLVLMALIGTFLTLGPAGAAWRVWMSDPVRADLVAFAASVRPVGLYFAVGEASSSGGTWGKRRMGLRVERSTGGRISFSRSALRSGQKLLPWQLAHTAMLHIPGFPMAPGEPPPWSPPLLGLAWALVLVYLAGLTRVGGRRTLYDRLAGTSCVRVAPTDATEDGG